MSIPELQPKPRLHGVSVFLSASVPTRERQDEYDRIPEAPLQIEEAVVCIARAVFVEGGTLVFGAHPSISPLVARVVGHYYLPAPAEAERRDTNGQTRQTNERQSVNGSAREADERPGRDLETEWKNPSVVIYQSRVWEPHWAAATEQLTRHPLVQLKWTDADPSETVDPKVKDRSQAPKSMKLMREQMIDETAPVAMIAIGGMRGVLNEAELFIKRWPKVPIFTLATTGGAAKILATNDNYRRQVQVIDTEAEGLVQKFWEQQREPPARAAQSANIRQQNGTDAPERGEERRKFYVPYAFVAQQIVARIVAGPTASPRAFGEGKTVPGTST
jgi:hypothetical protein